MIDWNGNGRIDPTDVGISLALMEEKNSGGGRRPKGGCLSHIVLSIVGTALCAMILGGVL